MVHVERVVHVLRRPSAHVRAQGLACLLGHHSSLFFREVLNFVFNFFTLMLYDFLSDNISLSLDRNNISALHFQGECSCQAAQARSGGTGAASGSRRSVPAPGLFMFMQTNKI